jgi:hypothetical protein
LPLPPDWKPRYSLRRRTGLGNRRYPISLVDKYGLDPPAETEKFLCSNQRTCGYFAVERDRGHVRPEDLLVR